MPTSFRKILIAAATFIGGLYFFLEFVTPAFLLPESAFGLPFEQFDAKINQSLILVSAMAIGLGVINLLRVHGTKIVRSRPGWVNSAALLFGMFFVFAIEIIDFRNAEERLTSLNRFPALAHYILEKNTVPEEEKFQIVQNTLASLQNDAATVDNVLHNPNSTELSDRLFGLSTELTVAMLQEPVTRTAFLEQLAAAEKQAREISEANYKNSNAQRTSLFVFEALFTPLGSAMFSLLAFYVATAAYRAFRIRSFEAAAMMLTAIIVMLGQIPHGPLYISENLPDIRNWLLLNVSTPAFRAIAFGAAIASLAMSVRMWLSLERSPLSDSEG